MAYVDEQWDPRKGNQNMPPQAGGAPAAGLMGGGTGINPSSAGGAPQTNPIEDRSPAGVGTGFVNLQSYLGLNQGAGQQMANNLAGNISQQGEKAKGDANALAYQGQGSTAATLGEVNPALYAQAGKELSSAGANAKAAGTLGGTSALLGQQYGQQGGYGSGMRGFDAFLARGAGGGTLDQASSQYGDLGKYLGVQESSYHPGNGWTGGGSLERSAGAGPGMTPMGSPRANYAPTPAPINFGGSGGPGPVTNEDQRRRRVM